MASTSSNEPDQAIALPASWRFALAVVLLAACGGGPRPRAAIEPDLPPPSLADATAAWAAEAVAPTQPAPAEDVERARLASAVRDPRQSRLHARARALLVVELQGLERLLAATAKSSLDRPVLQHRVAEVYVELEAAAARDESKAEEERAYARARQADQVMQAARRRAIDGYSRIVSEYPGYPQIDAVRYRLGLEYERASNPASARQVYFVLIEGHPSSRYVPYAYLGFAELYAAEAEADPSKSDLAVQAYTEVMKYPPPANGAYGYAAFRLGSVLWKKGDAARGEEALAKAIEFTSGYPDSPGASELAAAARAVMTSERGAAIP